MTPLNWLNTYIKNRQDAGNTVYLTGDEMFLEHMLDGNGELSPTSQWGWNIYSKVNKAQKGAVSSSGLRTDLTPAIDRLS